MKTFLFRTYIVIWLFIIAKLATSESDEGENDDGRGDCPCELETYGPEIEAGYIKSPDYPHFDGCDGRCTYIIMPHPNKSVTLFTAQYEVSQYASLEIFTFVKEGDRKILIPHAKIKKPSSYYYSSAEESFPTFISAKNAGFEIHFRSHTTHYYTSFKISFDRYYDYGEVCDYPVVEVGKDEVVIQRNHTFKSASGCVYLLKPKQEDMENEEDEIMLTLQGSQENMVTVRVLDKHGKRVELPQYIDPTVLMLSAYNPQVFSHKKTRTDGVYRFTTITARLVGKSCDCGPEEYDVDTENGTSVILQSPGFPELYCPSKRCRKQINSVKQLFDDDERIGLFDVSIEAVLGPRDELILKNDARTFFQSLQHSTRGVKASERFVIKQQELFLYWNSHNSYSRRSYEVKVNLVKIPLECSCTLFRDKEIVSARSFEFTFPKNCTFIYCYYKFKPQYYNDRSWSVEFNVNGAVKGDKVVIIDDKHTETYEGEILHKKRRFEVQNNCEFTFFREHIENDQETELTLVWDKTLSSDTCDGIISEHLVKPGEDVILTSPGYPQNYANSQYCQWLLEVEDENTRLVLSIDEIRLENFHDHIYIYQGNSTEGELLKTYTAHISHEVLNFTKLPIVLVLQTDQSTSDRGFHITVKAIPLDRIENPSYLLSFILIALVLLLIFLILLGIYILKIKREKAQANAAKAAAPTDAASSAGIELDNRNENENDLVNLDSPFYPSNLPTQSR